MTTTLHRTGDITYTADPQGNDVWGSLRFTVSTPLTDGWQTAIDDVMANASNHLIGGITIAADRTACTVLSPSTPEGIDDTLARVDYILEIASRFYEAKFHRIDDDHAADADAASAQRQQRRIAADYHRRALDDAVARHNSPATA